MFTGVFSVVACLLPSQAEAGRDIEAWTSQNQRWVATYRGRQNGRPVFRISSHKFQDTPFFSGWTLAHPRRPIPRRPTMPVVEHRIAGNPHDVVISNTGEFFAIVDPSVGALLVRPSKRSVVVRLDQILTGGSQMRGGEASRFRSTDRFLDWFEFMWLVGDELAIVTKQMDRPREEIEEERKLVMAIGGRWEPIGQYEKGARLIKMIDISTGRVHSADPSESVAAYLKKGNSQSSKLISVAYIAGELGGEQIKRELTNLLKSRAPDVRAMASVSLARLGVEDGHEVLARDCDSSNKDTQLRTRSSHSKSPSYNHA